MELQDYLNKSKLEIKISDILQVDLTSTNKRIEEIENTIARADCSSCAKGRYQSELRQLRDGIKQYNTDKNTVLQHIKQIDLNEQSEEQLKLISQFLEIKPAKTKATLVKNIEAKTK
jgi:hypothetical protein